MFDPKLIDEVETKGRIKLYFRDTSGLSVQVQKNLCSTQKAKKLEFRTAETIISRYNKDNKLASTITSKCINADAEVINAFGVSKAVLEHVIFCHQEDSNWPLSEGKVLKTRFDEIFAATKYIKALDVLRKIRLEKQQLIKQKEIERKFLEANKNSSEKLHRDLDENEAKYETLKHKQEALKEKIVPVQRQIDAYFQQSSKILDIKTQLDRIENEKQLLEKQMKELLVLTKNCLFSGTDAELKEHVKSYTTTTDKMRSEEEEAARKQVDLVNAQLRELNQQRSKLIVEIGALENKKKTYLENRDSLFDLLKKAASLMENTEFDVDEFVSSTTAQNNVSLDKFMNKLVDFIKSYQAETKSIEEANGVGEQRLQTQLEEQRDSKSKIDQSITIKHDLIEKNKRQLAQLQAELKLVANDKNLADLNEQIEECDLELEAKLMDNTDVTAIKKEMAAAETQRAALREKEKHAEVKLNKLHADSKNRTEIDMLKADKQAKEEQIRKLRRRIQEEIEAFFETDVEANEPLLKDIGNDLKLKSLFEKKLRTVLAELVSLENKHKEIEKRVCSIELKRKMHFDELRLKETQLRECEDKLLQIEDCIATQSDIDKFDSILEKLQEEHKSNLDEVWLFQLI